MPFASLVLVGRSDPRFPQVGNLVRGPLGAGVSIIDNADDTAVAGWLAAATALVFASRGEGFGFPVTEAFGQGTPAVVADAEMCIRDSH